MVLSTLPGVGERLAKKMTDHFGSEEAALSSLKSGDIGQIAEIDGVSPQTSLSASVALPAMTVNFWPLKKQSNYINN